MSKTYVQNAGLLQSKISKSDRVSRLLMESDVPSSPANPVLTLSPYVVSKIDFMIDSSDNEIGGFFIAENANEPLAITDFVLLKQEVTSVTVAFDAEAIADFYEEMAIVRKLEPGQCARIWAHTHPGFSAMPSYTDLDTFKEKFCNRGVPACCRPWAAMFIRSKSGSTFCRLAFNPEDGPQVQLDIDVVVDHSLCSAFEDRAGWKKEFEEKVSVKKYSPPTFSRSTLDREYERERTHRSGRASNTGYGYGPFESWIPPYPGAPVRQHPRYDDDDEAALLGSHAGVDDYFDAHPDELDLSPADEAELRELEKELAEIERLEKQGDD